MLPEPQLRAMLEEMALAALGVQAE